MGKSNAVRRIVLTGLVIGMAAACGGRRTQAGGADTALKMVPADSLFCVRINNLDQTLGQLDQYITEVSPTAVGPTVKMQLGGLLGNSMLAGIKTDGVFVVFGSLPADAKGPEALMQGLAVLVPVSDYGQFTAGSPNLGKPDANGVCKLEGAHIYAANLGGFALMGPSASADAFAAMAKTLKARPAKSLADVLDAGETTMATQTPLWIHANIPALARLVGPGAGDMIRQAGAGMTQAQAGPMPGADMKAFFDMYAGLAETFLKEGKSVAIMIAPKPTVLSVGVAVAALPGTSMADLLTKSSPSGLKDAKLLGYLEDGAVMTGAVAIDPATLSKFSQKGLDLLSALGGQKLSASDMEQIKAFVDDMTGALGKEMAFSASMDPQAKTIFSAKYVFELRDKDKWLRLFDKAADLMNGPVLAGYFNATGMKMGFEVQHAAATYQGVTIDSAKATIALKDPNSPEAQMMKNLYGDFEYRMAAVGELGVLVIGVDADANVRKLIDQVKAGGPKQTGAEIKAAMDAMPEAKNADLFATYNVVRMMSMGLAMMSMPSPAANVPTKSGLIFAGSMDKGKVSFHMALPKEHLTEMMQAFQQMVPRKAAEPEN
jgi:hypothetical protein